MSDHSRPRPGDGSAGPGHAPRSNDGTLRSGVTALPATVVVPGSTANLGPGFDALSLALAVYLRAKIVEIDEGSRASGRDGELRFTFAGLRLDGENTIERSLRAVAARYGKALPSMVVEVTSDIPLRAGLGSSAAAIVAGLRLYEAIAGPLPMADVLTLAGQFEGHPDNTSASILGGLTASCQAEDGRVLAVATPWPESVQVIVATPSVGLETKVARAALPASISRADAIFNLQRATLLLQAVRMGRYELLREAMRDRLHQPDRAALVPGLARALTFEHPQLLGVFLSGAGPSIAALTDGDAPGVRTLFETLYRDELSLPSVVRTLAVHQPETL